MNAIAGIFRTSEDADAAMGDLRLEGFPNVRQEPCREVAGRFPAGPKVFSGVAIAMPGNEPGGAFPMNLGGGTESWAMLQAFNLTDGKWREWADRGCTVVSVDAGGREAVARTILERNGVDEIYPTALPDDS